jgi:hypothetical protein
MPPTLPGAVIVLATGAQQTEDVRSTEPYQI